MAAMFVLVEHWSEQREFSNLKASFVMFWFGPSKSIVLLGPVWIFISQPN